MMSVPGVIESREERTDFSALDSGALRLSDLF